MKPGPYPLLQLLLLVVLAASCRQTDTDRKKLPVNSFSDIFTNLSADKEIFTFDNTKDFTIKGKKGTTIFLPAHCFVYKDGTGGVTDVTLELKECYAVTDFIADNLNTLSDGELLETAGMANIRATSNSRELVVDGQKSYVIAFPRKDVQGQMGIFYPKNDSIGGSDWQEDVLDFDKLNMGEGEGNRLRITDSSLLNCKIEVTGWLSYESNLTNDYTMGWKLFHKDSTIFTFFSNNFRAPDDMVQYLKQNDNRISMDLYINPNGKIRNIVFEKKGRYNKLVNDFLMNMPAFDMNSLRRSNSDYSFSLSISCVCRVDEEKYKKWFYQKYGQYKTKAIQAMPGVELENFVLSAGRLGWINCDRFLNTDTALVNFAVKIPVAGENRTYLVFEKLNSIMSGAKEGKNVVFKNIPPGQEVKIISIKYENNKPMMSITHTKTSAEAITLTNFKEFTLVQLANELNKPG
jgi:hypothetical protein